MYPDTVFKYQHLRHDRSHCTYLECGLGQVSATLRRAPGLSERHTLQPGQGPCCDNIRGGNCTHLVTYCELTSLGGAGEYIMLL